MFRLLCILVLSFLWACEPSASPGYREGFIAYERGDYETAYAKWLPLAQRGNASAQSGIAELYYRGAGVPQDYDKALQWWRKGAAQGHPRSQWLAGLLIGRGEGQESDRDQAIEFLCRSARQNFLEAKVTLKIIEDLNEFPSIKAVMLQVAGTRAGLKALGASPDDMPVPPLCNRTGSGD